MAEGEPWRPFPYTPSANLSIIFASVFGATTLLHTFQLARKRTWYLIPLVLGGYLEMIGFIARYYSRPNNLSILAPYLIQAIFILIAPTLFAASIYVVLGRIILLVDGERYSWFRQRHLTYFFVIGDVLSLNLQSNGGGLTSGDSKTSVKIGQTLIVLGLAVRLLFFGLFIAVSLAFHYRLRLDRPVKKHASFVWARPLAFWRRWMRANPHRPSSSSYASHEPSSIDLATLPWKRHLHVLYVTSVLVLVRSVFRVVEYVQGEEGYLLSREVYLYACDAALMVTVMVLFNVVHPSQITHLHRLRLRAEAAGSAVELAGLGPRGGRGGETATSGGAT